MQINRLLAIKEYLKSNRYHRKKYIGGHCNRSLDIHFYIYLEYLHAWKSQTFSSLRFNNGIKKNINNHLSKFN